jgi:hypothetical protein
MSDADIEASRVYRKLDERGLIKCPLWLAFRTFPRYQKGVIRQILSHPSS